MQPLILIIEPIEVVVSALVVLLAFILTTISVLAYRRERDRRLAIVSVAYGAFVLRGGVVFVDHVFPRLFRGQLIEHLSGLLVPAAMVLFLVAIRKA